YHNRVESFRKACDVLGQPYPAFFHWKLLTTLWFFLASMFLGITNITLGALFSPESKRGKFLSRLSDLYYEAQYCSEYRGLLDFILVSLKIL
ncbi:hypothetical protein, partial [Salmonella enterica]|uniref:hypothetical protein n=1 Tax=Salmonella enterica TaxID=28901 RepID=UPI003D29A524